MDCGIVKQNCVGTWVILSLVDSGLGWTGTAWVAHTNGLGISEPLLDFPDHTHALDYARGRGIQAVVVGAVARELCSGLDTLAASLKGVRCKHPAGHIGACVPTYYGTGD